MKRILHAVGALRTQDVEYDPSVILCCKAPVACGGRKDEVVPRRQGDPDGVLCALVPRWHKLHLVRFVSVDADKQGLNRWIVTINVCGTIPRGA